MNNLYQKDKDVVLIRRTSGNKEFEEYPLVVQPSTVLAVNPSNDIICYPISNLSVNVLSASYATTVSQIIPDTYGHGGTCLMLNAFDNGTPMYLHVDSGGNIQATASPMPNLPS